LTIINTNIYITTVTKIPFNEAYTVAITFWNYWYTWEFYYAYEYKNYFYEKFLFHKAEPLQQSTVIYLTHTRSEADRGET